MSFRRPRLLLGSLTAAARRSTINLRLRALLAKRRATVAAARAEGRLGVVRPDGSAIAAVFLPAVARLRHAHQRLTEQRRRLRNDAVAGLSRALVHGVAWRRRRPREDGGGGRAFSSRRDRLVLGLASSRRRVAARLGFRVGGSVAGDFNRLAPREPLLLAAAFGASKASAFAAIAGVCATAGLPPELAVGYVLSRATGKLRVPLNCLLASGVSAAVPQLGEFRVRPVAEATRDAARAALGPALCAHLDALAPAPTAAAAKTAAFVDAHAVSFYAAGSFTNVATIGGGALAAAYGVDLPGALASAGLAEEIGAGVGGLAAASVLNSLLFPAHLWATVRGAEAVVGVRDSARRRRRRREHHQLALY